jgi:lipopolysaccharide biosynthesis glycosyltransferase
MNEPMNICYCGNDRMFDAILLSSLSIARVTKRPISVFILTGSLKKNNKKYIGLSKEDGEFIEKAIRAYNPNSSAKVIDVSKEFLSLTKHSINFHSVYTPYAYMRLILDVLPDMPDRMLYLDTDIMVLKNIDSLYDMDMGANDIALVPDQVGTHYFGKRYGNTGVLLINLKQVRQDGSFKKARWRVNHIAMFMPDQTALNIVCSKSKILLPFVYNEQLDLHEDTIIRHYCKRLYWLPIVHTINVKPWNVEHFRAHFGEKLHFDLLEEFVSRRNEREKEKKEGASKEGSKE